MIMSSIIASFLVALILLIWFKSDAFIQWSKLFGLSKFIKLDEYESYKLANIENNISLTYPLFLKTKYNNFFLKLIGCVLCSSVWISSIAGIVVGIFTALTLEIVMSLSTLIVLSLLYSIITMPIICIISLYIYGIISKMLNENK